MTEAWNVFARDQATPEPRMRDERRDELERLQLVLGQPAARAAIEQRLRQEEARRFWYPGTPAGSLEYHEGRKDALRDLLADLDITIPRS